jgi:2-phosphoglycerate kinase
MRALFTEEFLPAIHMSSFDAGKALPTAQEEEVDPLLHGFLEQTRHVLVGVQAAIDRSLAEGWSMVLEGVHVVPGMLPRQIEGALTVECVISIDNEETHAGHFWIRDLSSDGLRPLDKYLERIGDIRYLQDFIVERAQVEGVPVIENSDREKAIGAVMELVLNAADSARSVPA